MEPFWIVDFSNLDCVNNTIYVGLFCFLRHNGPVQTVEVSNLNFANNMKADSVTYSIMDQSGS